MERLDLGHPLFERGVGGQQVGLGLAPFGHLTLALLVGPGVVHRDGGLGGELHGDVGMVGGVEARLVGVEGEHAGRHPAEHQRNAHPASNPRHLVRGVGKVGIGVFAQDVGDDHRLAGANNVGVGGAAGRGVEADAGERLQLDAVAADDDRLVTAEFLHRGGVERHHLA